MKKQATALLSATVLALAGQQARASVVISNFDPADYSPATAEVAQEIGQSVITGSRGISLTSVDFPQSPDGVTPGETFAVYSRNANGTVGSSLYAGFTLDFDSATDTTVADVTGSFTLTANTGYYFVLLSNSALKDAEWNYSTTSDYSSQYGATFATTDTSFSNVGPRTTYYNLSDGPQVIQVNGVALPVPEPSAAVFIGLALAGGLGIMVRRRAMAA